MSEPLIPPPTEEDFDVCGNLEALYAKAPKNDGFLRDSFMGLIRIAAYFKDCAGEERERVATAESALAALRAHNEELMMQLGDNANPAAELAALQAKIAKADKVHPWFCNKCGQHGIEMVRPRPGHFPSEHAGCDYLGATDKSESLALVPIEEEPPHADA